MVSGLVETVSGDLLEELRDGSVRRVLDTLEGRCEGSLRRFWATSWRGRSELVETALGDLLEGSFGSSLRRFWGLLEGWFGSSLRVVGDLLEGSCGSSLRRFWETSRRGRGEPAERSARGLEHLRRGAFGGRVEPWIGTL
jgi:hypothetical protein